MQQQCGVCSALSSLFRRIMCIPPSRRGSHESSQPHNEHHDSLSSGAADSPEPSAQLIPMSGDGGRRGSGSEGACPVIVARPRGRFLTMHKRRRKRLTTRSLHESPALLDDIHHGLVQCILERVWQWPFNAFILDTVTGGRSLPVLCVHLFHWYGLMDHFKLDVVLIWKFFSIVEEGYHSTNPYHNSIHATDVTQAMHCFLQEEKIREHLTPVEIMSALIAAVTHDLDHPGVNQPFLIATSNHLAALYQNTSVLENHHWRSAMGCLLESHLGYQLSEFRPELERQISSLILATDITRQQEFLTRFKKYLDEDSLDMRKAEDRHFILQIALKCADISNPCRPWDVSRKWSIKVCEEFFRQGDYERQLNLPVTSLCDRQTTSIPKIQTGFLRFVVAPLFEEWHRFLDTGLSSSMMSFLRSNHAKWEALIQEELAEETRTEISEAEELEEVDMESETVTSVVVSRRHSVPSSRILPPQQPHLMHRRYTLVPPVTPVLHFDEDEEISCRSEPSEERPVSSESLLPEVSIATMAPESRLASVLHNLAPPAPPHRLTRQQTFPPVQPYVRSRYMSTTAEMSTSLSSSSSSTSSENHSNRPSKTKCIEKENVDPSERDSVKQMRKSLIQVQVGLSRRRGSAPVVSAVVNSTFLNGCSSSSGQSGFSGARRGSVPTESSCQSVLRPVGSGFKVNSGCGPAPPPLPPAVRTNQGGDVEERVRKCRRKKLLARRSSGGPENFLPPPKSPTPSWRRASLPLDVLAPSFLCRSSSMKETMRH